MPELPEVENVRQTLIPLVVGNTIEKIDIYYGKMIKQPDDTEQFKEMLQGETIQDVKRRGKFLLFYTDHYCIISHLRMEGKYKYVGGDVTPEKHVHVEFYFTNGQKLQYHDVRKFGTFHVCKLGEEMKEDSLRKLGVEPFMKEWEDFSLYDKIHASSRPIKTALLDQTIIAGLGNIYVDEVLFRSSVHPSRKASSITKEEAEKLQNETKYVLEKAVKNGGSTIRSYVNTQGKKGTYQDFLQVYGKKGESCPNCDTEIEKIKLGGRGTHFCPTCQVDTI